MAGLQGRQPGGHSGKVAKDFVFPCIGLSGLEEIDTVGDGPEFRVQICIARICLRCFDGFKALCQGTQFGGSLWITCLGLGDLQGLQPDDESLDLGRQVGRSTFSHC